MVSSQAETVEQYLAELDSDRREDISALRQLALKYLPAGLEEVMNFGMIVYQVPSHVVPETYNGQPLVFAGIASQKQYISLYLMSIYAWEAAREEFEAEYLQSGKKMNVGKSCIRFKNLAAMPEDVVIKAMGKISMEQFVARYLEVKASARKMRVKK